MAVFALLLAAAAAVAAYAFPALLTMDANAVAERFEALEPVELNGETLFLSDLHLTDPDTRLNIPLDGVEHVVIIGDFFQSPGDFLRFGSASQERIENGLKVFLPDGYRGTVHFISAWAHDPQLQALQFETGGVEFTHMGKAGKFVIGEHTVVATHGEEFFRGVLGGASSRLTQVVGLPLLLERIARARMDLPEDTWLITAHSHVPAFHEGSLTANTGSFAGVPFNSILRVHVGTGVRFDDDGTELVKYEGITPTLWP